MASSDTEIANLALSHLGVGADIADLTEKSAEAKACNRFFNTCRDELLRISPWPFATKFFTLSLLTSSADASHPTDEWNYVYQVPADCVFVRRILSGIRRDTNSSRVEFKIVYADSGLLIYCDEASAEIEYTARVTAIEKYPPDFVMAMSFRLAAYIAPRVTAGDPFKMTERALHFFQLSTSIAAANAFNEENDSQEPVTDLVRARD